MRQKKFVGILTLGLLLCSASFAFASLAIWSLPNSPVQFPEPSDHPGFNPIGEPETSEMLQKPVQTAGSRYFLEYKTWRHIQASA